MSNQDKLRLLGQTATEVPSDVREHLEKIAMFYASFEQGFLSDDFLSEDEDFQARFGEAESLVREFITDSAELQQELVTKSGEVEAALTEFSQTLGQEAGQLFLEIDQLKSEIAALSTAVEAEAGRIEAAAEEAQRAADEMAQVLETRKAGMQSSYEAAVGACSTVKDATCEFEEDLEAQVATLEQAERSPFREEIQQAWDAAERQIIFDGKDLFREDAQHLAEQFSEQLTDSLAAPFSQAITDGIRPSIDHAVELFDETADGLQQKITEASEKTSRGREKMQPAIDRLQSAVRTVDELVDRAREVAARFSEAVDIF